MVNRDHRLEGSSGWIARWAWVYAGLAVAIQSTAHLVNELALGGRYPELAPAVDGSAFGRANTFAIVLSALLTAVAGFRGVPRYRAFALSAALTLVAIDDAWGFHDRLRALPRATEAAAALGFAAVLALVLLLLCAEAKRMRRAPRRLLLVGLLALVGGVVVRLAGAFVTVETTLGDTARVLGVAVEQGLDLGGWILVASGLAASLRDRS